MARLNEDSTHVTEAEHPDVALARRIFDDADGWEAAARDAHAAVARWVWASPWATLHRREPLAWQQEGLAGPGKLLPGQPETPSEEMQYGLDAAGQFLISRQWQPGGHAFETVHVFDGDTEIRRMSDRDGRPVAVRVLRERGGRFAHRVVVSKESAGMTTYAYDGDLVTAIRTWNVSDNGTGEEYTYDVEYDDHGRPSRLTAALDGRPLGVLWQASGAGDPDKLRRRFAARLALCAPELVAAELGQRTPIWAVAFQYRRDAPAEGALVVYLRSQQDIVADVTVEPRALAYWNPAEALARDAAVWIPFERDPELRALQDLLRFERDDPQAERDAVLTAAKRARRAPWPTDKPVTVFAVDLELEYLDDDLRTVLSASDYRRLTKNGVLPQPG